MPKRKVIKQVFDDECKFSRPELISKRRRRDGDVIDSTSKLENIQLDFPQLQTAMIHSIATDDEGLSSPTSTSSNPFGPEWITRRPSDILDAEVIHRQTSVSSSCSNYSENVTAQMIVAKNAECYNMNHKNRGKCIVFNHEIFDTGYDNRDGSTLDASRIERTFTNLGFTVEILNNLTYQEVSEKITELSEENHDDNDCICIFMLTHGVSSDLIFAKDVAYKAESIWKPFTAEKCTSLAGKPKLFFFQACRGNEPDGGVRLQRDSAMNTTETDSGIKTYKLPTHADFLIAHSTVQGFLSWRNPKQGTWFIQCLCDVLDEYHKTTDLLKMLTICSRKVATDYTSHNDISSTSHSLTQVPSITSMLIRDLYFIRI